MSNEIHQKRQHNKFAYFFGTMNQSAFYKALEKIQGVSTIARFNQSGFTGFLPLSELGVCGFFTLDYARATNEGRAHEWIKHIEQRDQQFISYLIAEQKELYEYTYMRNTVEEQLVSLSELNRAISNLPTHRNPVKNVVDNYQYDFLGLPDSAEDCAHTLAEKMSPLNYNSEDTCMEAPHFELVIELQRKGVVPSRFFCHSLVFSMATTENGGLDPSHIICVDANSGAFKIKNDPETINEFLIAFDEHLVGELSIETYTLNQVTVKSIPEKGTDDWAFMKTYIEEGQQLGHDANYLLSDLHQLNFFLRQQVEKLETSRNSEWILFFKNTFEKKTDEKIMKLKKIHRETQAELHKLIQAGENPVAFDTQLTEITRRMYLETKDAVQIHRKFFSCGQTDSEHKLNQLNLSIR